MNYYFKFKFLLKKLTSQNNYLMKNKNYSKNLLLRIITKPKMILLPHILALRIASIDVSYLLTETNDSTSICQPRQFSLRL